MLNLIQHPIQKTLSSQELKVLYSLNKHSLLNTSYTADECDVCNIHPCEYYPCDHKPTLLTNIYDKLAPLSTSLPSDEVLPTTPKPTTPTPVSGTLSTSSTIDPSPYLVKFYDAYIGNEPGICLVMEVSKLYKYMREWFTCMFLRNTLVCDMICSA